jgi:hypothetical protein
MLTRSRLCVLLLASTCTVNDVSGGISPYWAFQWPGRAVAGGRGTKTVVLNDLNNEFFSVDGCAK